MWPTHCVQNTHGCKFSDKLKFDKKFIVVRKGKHKEID